MNEYTNEELGLEEKHMKKIVSLMLVKDSPTLFFLKLIKSLPCKAYCILANSDIFFDSTLSNLHKTCLSTKQSVYALLRFEYLRNKLPSESKIFCFPKTGPVQVLKMFGYFIPIFHQANLLFGFKFSSWKTWLR